MKVTRVVHEAEGRRKRVAAYVRVSTLCEEQGESFEAQMKYFKTLIESVRDWEFVEIYADQGITGVNAKKRNGFTRMIEDAVNGKIDIILVKSISRFARNSKEAQMYIHKLKESNVEVRFEREGISSLNPQSEMVFNFMAAIAQEESKSISENMKWTYQRLAERGIRHIGNNHVLGYAEIEGKLVPNEDAWIPKLIFEEYAAGLKSKEIIKHLDERGARRMRKKDSFQYSTINYILRNEIYVGDRKIQKKPPIDYLTKRPDYTKSYDSFYIKDDHEGIVSREVWKKVQRRIKSETEKRAKKKGNL
ncbi:MAG: recombinase family protein [Lachnospiraceae bacterium]|nr:recombinase family protein [Lachnospiraceae bacterium]